MDNETKAKALFYYFVPRELVEDMSLVKPALNLSHPNCYLKWPNGKTSNSKNNYPA